MASLVPAAGRGRGRGRGKREREDEESDGRARFYRDDHGDLQVLKPGETHPDEIEDENKTEEDLQYEAYLAGKNRGAISKIGGYSDGIDRAAVADSASARDAEAQSGERGKYAPARAYNRSAKFKQSKGSSSAEDSGAVGAMKMELAMRRARECSDDEDEDEDALSLNALQLANRAMETYNSPISNMPQLDVHGNDLRLPQLERKLRKFLDCFAEDIAVKTVEGQPVLRDLEQFRKRYATVFRESGVQLRGEVRKRFYMEVEGSEGSSCKSWTLDFEKHTHLVTPRPGLALDGSMGVLPPRDQELVVLYEAVGGEISGMWISRDAEGLGGAGADRRRVEESDVFQAFRERLKALSNDAPLQIHFNDYLAEQ